jgi:hypothetical protein
MKLMHEISRISPTIWVRTDRPVVPTKTADWHHLLEVQNALQQGVFAIGDSKRPEFFEIEIRDNWYYIHIPSRIGGVYLIAANRMPRKRPDERPDERIDARHERRRVICLLTQQ